MSRAIDIAVREVRMQVAEALSAGYPVKTAVEQARANLDDMEPGSTAWQIIQAATDHADRIAAFDAAHRLCQDILDAPVA